MWLHHACAQRAHSAAGRRDRSRATPAATARRRTRIGRSTAGRAAIRITRLRCTTRAIQAVVVAVPPRFHLELALQALAAGKHVLVEKPAFPRLVDYRTAARRTRPCRACRARRRERPLQAACGMPARAAGRGRDWRDGVRAHHHARPAAQDRRRLAQRRDDGGWRCVLRGGDPLVAPGGQPRAHDHVGDRLPAGRVAGRPRSPGQEHACGVPVRQRRRRLHLLLARGAVAAAGASGSRSCSDGAASSRSSRTARSCWCAAAACRGCCCRGYATRAAIRPCTGTSCGPSG